MANKKEDKPKKRKKLQKGLFRRYNIAKKTNPDTKKPELVPGKPDPKDPLRVQPIKFPNDLKKAWDFFNSDATITNSENTYENRRNRYEQLEFMVYNEGLMYTSAQTFTYETTQADSQNRIVGIKASKKEIEKDFYEWLSFIGADNNVLQDTAWDLTVYADHFWLNSFDIDSTKGITEIVPVDPFECVDRMEFQGIKVKKAMQNSNFNGHVNRYSNLQKLAQSFSDEKNQFNDYASWYKSYLFGFGFGDPKDPTMTPPWYVNHFRRFSSRSEFFPFGRPLFIGSLARYKSYKSTEMLIDMARVASFPTKVFEIQGSPDMTQEELYEKINEAREMYENITEKTKNPDEIGVSEPLFTVDGLITFTQYESRLNLDQLGDLGAKRQDLVMSTGIPFGYLESGDRSWGQSGQSLLQQSKIVARKVYSNQTAMLDILTSLYKFHLFLTGNFEGEKTQFELYMNYPVVEESSDRMRIKSDSIRLATDILSNLSDQLGLDRGEALPTDIVKDVFGKYSFLDMSEVSDWVDAFEKSKEQDVDVSGEDKSKFFASVTRKKNNSLKEKYDNIITDQKLREMYFDAKKNQGFTEGVSHGKHYKSSFGADNNNIDLVKQLQPDRISD